MSDSTEQEKILKLLKKTILELKNEKEISENIEKNKDEYLNDGLDHILKLLQIYNVLDSDDQESLNKNQELINRYMKRLQENTSD
ncbi:hypothetical protein ACO0OL_000984 [Hanseniaspora opuntiae]|jgi:hypothetical protein